MREPSHDAIGTWGLGGRGGTPSANMKPGPEAETNTPLGPTPPPTQREEDPTKLLWELIGKLGGPAFREWGLTTAAYAAMLDAEYGREHGEAMSRAMDVLEELGHDITGDFAVAVRKAIEAERLKAVDPPPLQPAQMKDWQLREFQSEVDEEVWRRFGDRR